MKPSREPFDLELELTAHLFGDARDPAAVDAALAGSAELRRQLDELRRTLELVDEPPVPHRGSDYGAEVWARLEPQLDAAPAALPVVRRRLRATPRWLALAAVALMLLGAGFLLGRIGRPDGALPGPAADSPAGTEVAAALSERGRERLLTAALGDHLGHSERLLAELSNADSDSGSGAALESAWASDLLLANRLYRRAAEQAGQKRLARLLAELEPVWLELAHGGNERSDDELRQLRRRVDEHGLLFKVRVTGGRLAGPATTPDET